MVFWALMLLSEIIIPVTFIVFGKIFLNGAATGINRWFGYRTPMSMKNEDTWNFAHSYCGKLWFAGGLVFLPLSLIAGVAVIGKTALITGITCGVVCCCQVIFIFISVICTEAALRKSFDKNGNRR